MAQLDLTCLVTDSMTAAQTAFSDDFVKAVVTQFPCRGGTPPTPDNIRKRLALLTNFEIWDIEDRVGVEAYA